MSPRPHLLLIGPEPAHLDGTLDGADVEPMRDDPVAVAARIRAGGVDAVLASAETTAGLLERVRRDELVLTHVDKGLAVLDAAGTVVWANPAFTASAACPADPVGLPLFEALGGARVLGPDPAQPPDAAAADPLAPARAGRPLSFRLHCPAAAAATYFEADVRPIPDSDPPRLVAVIRNVTEEVVQRQKLDALHAAGRELAALDPGQVAEMNAPSRAALLKQNLRRLIHDLLRYDTIEVRVLDRHTGELKPLIEDGMTPEAAGRVLFARPTGNGVTGHVAYTGVSYLCHDATDDPLYLRGAEGARSSMTVPLKVQTGEVVGTLNVESPRPNAFGPDDLQFTELFSREVAAALNTLDLLAAQEECTANLSIAAVHKEIALPLDEVLASASLLIGKAFADPETAAHLRKILDNARLVKESVGRVGREMTPRPSTGLTGEFPALDPAAPPPAAAPPPVPLVGRRVLVVDADERVRRQAHLLLTRLGATVETASTATAGLALAGDTAYDAVFLAVKPPDMGGYDCYRRFKTARPDSTLALTTDFGYDVAHSIVKARQDGLRYVLFKPFREEQVVTAVLDGAARN